MSERFFRHLDGGYYRLFAEARCAETTGPLVVYEHLWPFEPGLWVRERDEFFSRFTPVDEAEVRSAQAGERAAAQAAVTEAKAQRRAARGL